MNYATKQISNIEIENRGTMVVLGTRGLLGHSDFFWLSTNYYGGPCQRMAEGGRESYCTPSLVGLRATTAGIALGPHERSRQWRVPSAA